MKKFYMFTTDTAEDRRKELLDFVNKFNKKYNSYNSVIAWLKDLNSYYIMDSDGFEFADESTEDCSGLWGHGGLIDYDATHHILVNTNITLGEL